MNELQKENAIMNGDNYEEKCKLLDKECERLQAENEKLKALLDSRVEKAYDHNTAECKRCMNEIELKSELVRSETIKEFAEKVKEKIDVATLASVSVFGNKVRVWDNSMITDWFDQIAKEMTEGEEK